MTGIIFTAFLARLLIGSCLILPAPSGIKASRGTANHERLTEMAVKQPSTTEKWNNICDSLQAYLSEKQLSELHIRYETAKKDKKIAFMSHEHLVKNRQITGIMILFLLALIFSFLLYLQYRTVRRSNRLIKKSNLKKDLALENIAYIQSHDIRKPLTSIMGLIHVIKIMNYQVDKECLLKLEEAAEELDAKIRFMTSLVETKAKSIK